ncbi:phosphatase PAP2 family protein [Hymenobacter saemangeumensis]|uniref:phosphatase PAP2 family protein n=1 Tax=Hymenobacter saemangeumensis TaxID=1084522 RepID=UPI0031EE4E0E
MASRTFWWFTASTLIGCTLFILFIDQPVAWFIYRNLEGLSPLFAAVTLLAEQAYAAVIEPQVLGLPILITGLLGSFLLVRILLKRAWGTVFLMVLLVHLSSQIGANILKVTVHRLRPEVLFEQGYSGWGFWQAGPNNDSFPSGHVAGFFSLFWPFVVAFPRYRFPLVALPILIGIGRLIPGYHYVSDVWFSAWMVIAFTELFYGLGLILKKRKVKFWAKS